ncbi:unnamed protein product [Microthlaspi erraticum]|uniref:Peptidase C1A papain C-terminal domain-containing protein n=1 Tax=Microthlaspi erraticum TaxID=1685480 RepID=A0A6D2HMS2_9BRAS|nr:unnamed protein product [Microthlaspi erraticum]
MGGEEGELGGRKKQNPQAQAKEHALKKAAQASSSSTVTNKLSFQEIFGIDTIIKDWSSISHIVAKVMDQGVKDICWAICFARLVQAIYNMQNPHDANQFSIDDLIGSIKPEAGEKSLALANLKKAFKHLSTVGVLKMPTRGHGMAGDKRKRVTEDFDMYEDVDASAIEKKLDMFPVALRFETDVEFTENTGQIYYLPKKMPVTAKSRLHCLLLIGYGVTKEGERYFIGQNSYGENWGCQGYIRIVIKNKCDIICKKD